MEVRYPFRKMLVLVGVLLLPAIINAQGTLADYERAQTLRTKFQGLAINLPERTNWIEKTSRFWYKKSVKGGNEFVLVDAETLAKKPAFDQDKLANSLSAATGEKYKALELPFTSFNFVDTERAIQFFAGDSSWKCDLTNYVCSKLGPADRRGPGVPLQLRGLLNRPPDQPKASPDGAGEAFVKNYNIYLRSKDKKEELALSFDGSEDNYYT